MINSGYSDGGLLGLSDGVDMRKGRNKGLPLGFALSQNRRVELPFTELCGNWLGRENKGLGYQVRNKNQEFRGEVWATHINMGVMNI